jgi:type IV pilus assembly protein PilV
MNSSGRYRSAGFSMIEVLVSLLITVIGVLGMVALQSKAIPYSRELQ